MSSIYKRLPVDIQELVDAELSAHYRNVNRIDKIMDAMWRDKIRDAMDALLRNSTVRSIIFVSATTQSGKSRSIITLMQRPPRYSTSFLVLESPSGDLEPRPPSLKPTGINPSTWAWPGSNNSNTTANQANKAKLLKRVREMKEDCKISHLATTPPREMRCGRRQIRREGVRGDARRRHGNRRVVKHGAWYGRGR
jgi:hypothetical protein